MSQRYIGSSISPTAAPTSSTSTTGVWSINDQYQAKNASNWPMYVPPASNDPQFNYVTMLLHGDGTNGAQNNTFLDSSTNNFTITRNGNTTQGSLGPYGSSWSNYFDGTGDYLSLSDNAAFQMGTGDFTVECWVCPSTLSATDSRLWSYQAAGSATVFNLYLLSTGSSSVFSAEIRSSTGTSDVQTNGTTSAKAGTWYHVAFIRSSGTTKLFVNGVQEGATQTSQTQSLGSGVPAIGYYPAGSSNYFTGYISNFRILKGVAAYTSAFTPSTTPLTAIANTSLLTCQSNTFVDNSPNNFAITKNGDTSVQRFSPFGPVTTTPYYSGYFDGTGDYLTAPDSTAFDLTGDYTIEMWYYPLDLSASSNFFSLGNESAGQNGMTIYWKSTSSAISLYVNGASIITSSIATPVNSWYHVALVRNGSGSNNTTLYINGVSAGTTTNTTSYTGVAGNGVSIGASYSGSFAAMKSGYISNARIVKGTAVYTSAFTPPTTPLTAISGTSLLTCQSSTFIDNSTNNFTISAFGNSTPRTLSPFTTTSTTGVSYSTSVFGGNGYFDGTGDYLSIPDNNAFWIEGDFTIEAWVYPTVLNATNTILAQWPGGGPQDSFTFRYDNNRPYFAYDTGSGGVGVVGTTTSVLANAWNHIAVSRSGSTIRLFVNGIQDATTGSVSGAFRNSTAAIEVGRTAGASLPTGYMSQVRMVKGTALYTSNFVPSPTPLTAITNTSLLTSMTNGAIYDNAMMNDLETVGNAQISTSVKKYGTGSMYFDGTGDYLVGSNNPNLSLGNGNFTLEMWMYHGTGAYLNTQPVLLQNWSTTWAANYWSFHADHNSSTAGKFTLWVYNSSSSVPLLVSTSTSKTSTWNHVAIVRNGNSFTMYVNGTSEATATFAGSMDGGGFRPIYVGGPSQAYDGYIDDLRITKGYARYTANFTPPTAALPNY